MWRLMLANFLAVDILYASAFAPIRWGGLPASKIVLAPKGFPNLAFGSPHDLTILGHRGGMSRDMTPHFSSRLDGTIAVSGANKDFPWCIEAVGKKRGDAVRVNRCTGGPAQRWNWLPLGNDRYNLLQLRETTKCLDVIDDGSVNGASIELRECEDKQTESWKLEEPIPPSSEALLQRLASSFSVRHAAISLVLLAAFGSLSLSGWLWRWRREACKVSMSQGHVLSRSDYHGGVCLATPLTTCQSSERKIPVLDAAPQRMEDRQDETVNFIGDIGTAAQSNKAQSHLIRRVSDSEMRASVASPPHDSELAGHRVMTEGARLPMPHVLDAWKGAELLNADPQAWILRGVLSSDECEALVHSATAGDLDEVAYDHGGGESVLVDWDDLKPKLASLAAIAGAAHTAYTLQDGKVLQDAVSEGGAIMGAFGAGALALTHGVKVAMRAAVTVFTGTKWDGASMKRGSPAATTVERFVATLERALLCDRSHMERPLVSRYEIGEQQRVHTDARLGEFLGMEEFRASGGARLAQAVAYLKRSERGGETKFHHPAMRYLAVPPTQGDMLIFFPSFADGAADDRVPHSSEPVLAGQKYILNTWVCQSTVARMEESFLCQNNVSSCVA